MDSFNKLILFISFLIYSNLALSNAVATSYINSNYSNLSIRAPVGYSVLKGTPSNILRSAANSSGFVMSGNVSASINGSKLPLTLVSKITPFSIANAVAKAAFRPVPLMLLSAFGGSIIKAYSDHFLSNDVWYRPKTGFLYTNSYLYSIGIPPCEPELCATYFENTSAQYTYVSSTKPTSDTINLLFNSPIFGYKTIYLNAVEANIGSEPATESSLNTAVLDQYLLNPSLMENSLDQLFSNDVFPESIDTITGPSSIVGDVSTVTLPETTVVDSNSNQITTQDKVITTVNYNLNYNADNSITINPTKFIKKVTDTVSTQLDPETGLPIAPPVFTQSAPKITTETQTSPTGDIAPVDPPKNICETNPESLACAKIGTLSTAPDVITTDLPFSYSPVSLTSNAVCPVPKNFVFAGRSYSFSNQYLCDFSIGLNPVVLAVCGISAVLIVSGGIRNG